MTTSDILLFISEWLGVIAIVWVIGMIPSFQFRPVKFIYPKREGIISISLYAVMLIAAFVITTGKDRLGLVAPETVPLALWIRLLIGGIGLVAFGLSLLARRQPLLSIGWNPKRINQAGRLALALALGSIFLRGKAGALTNGFSPLEVSMLLVWLGIAFAEETIFRGFIQFRFNTIFGNRLSWLLTALLYVVWSIPFLMLAPETFLFRLLFTLVQGLLLGFVELKIGHVLPVFVYRAISEWLVFAS